MSGVVRWTMLATHVPPDGGLGGIVRYTVELSAALALRPDVDLTVVGIPAARDWLQHRLDDRARVVNVPAAPTALLSAAERWSRRFAGPAADVVQGAKHLVPHRSDALRVLAVHDMLLLDRPGDFGLGKRLLLPPVYRGSIRDADLLLCVSDATRTRLGEHAPAALNRAEVVRLATSSALREAAPRAVETVADRRFALVVGDPTPRKNLRTLLAAWPRVRAEVPDAVLAVAGPPSWGRTDVGPEWQALVDVGAVAPLGHVDDAELRWCYDHAAVVLCPSLAEGFGLPVAEALDLGAPVVISDDPALREVAAGRARAVVPARDVRAWSRAIVTALTSPTPRVAAGPVRTWDDVADETVAAVRRRISS